MSNLERIKNTLTHTLQNQMKVVGKLLDKIRPEDVNFHPCDHLDSYSLGELVVHMYEMVFAYSKAVRKGTLETEDFLEIPAPSKNATLPQVKDYMQQVSIYFKDTIEQLTETQLEQSIHFVCWHGFKMNGFQSLMTIPEEILHHRGQLTLYIRLLGYELPVGYIYDYS